MFGLPAAEAAARAHIPAECPYFLPCLLTGAARPKRMPSMKRPALSLDWWTVIVGFALAALVIAGLPALPW
jgi:hypothetical protein